MHLRFDYVRLSLLFMFSFHFEPFKRGHIMSLDMVSRMESGEIDSNTFCTFLDALMIKDSSGL